MTDIADTPQISDALVLPLEVVEAVMDIAVATLDPPWISSIALLSHYFRILANITAFSSVNLVD
ncbi:hypothetical protein CVT25_005397 [Psilocybe cyanescens]|uniref:F-box domain-containing protein n=1 Tax=Psilocybe cyanescens TaxID=93625 RepID=A0A409WXA2_PSICY|nr:hypothetical protein CVT25_005397 [Psilocybe cyanescens]